MLNRPKLASGVGCFLCLTLRTAVFCSFQSSGSCTTSQAGYPELTALDDVSHDYVRGTKVRFHLSWFLAYYPTSIQLYLLIMVVVRVFTKCLWECCFVKKWIPFGKKISPLWFKHITVLAMIKFPLWLCGYTYCFSWEHFWFIHLLMSWSILNVKMLCQWFTGARELQGMDAVLSEYSLPPPARVHSTSTRVSRHTV